MRPSPRRLGWLLSSLILACAPGDARTLSSPPEPGSTVVNRESAWTRGTRWKLSGSPEVEIGGTRGKGPSDLLKVVGVIQLDDGRVVVANGSTAELKFFGRDGAYLTSAGGQGWQRGNFQVLGWIQPLETGEIVAYDEAQRALLVFDADGTYSRNLMAGYDPRANRALIGIEGVFDDESVLIHQSRLAPSGNGLQRSDDWFVRVPKEGLPVTVTDAFPGDEIDRKGFINGQLVSRPPFGRSLHAALAPTRFYVGDDDHYRISAYSPEGTLLHVVSLEGAERPLTPDAIDEYMDIRIARNRDLSRAVLEPPLRAQITHATMPAFSALRADVDGNLWARDYDYHLPVDQRERWHVFDPNGRYLGPLEMPKGFAMLTAGSDYIGGVWRDSYGNEQARIYKLKKPARR